jgi:hypothetical protein
MSQALTTDQVEAQVSQNADDEISAQKQAAEGIVAHFETEMIDVTKEDFLERWYKAGCAEALAEAEITDRNLVRGALASLRGRVSEKHLSIAERELNLAAKKQAKTAAQTAMQAAAVQRDTAFQDAVALIDERTSLITLGHRIWFLQEIEDPRTGKREPHYFSRHDMEIEFAHLFHWDGKKKWMAFDAWMESPNKRRYKGVTFDPTGQLNPAFYNMWQGWGVEPSAEGSWDRFRAHIFENICQGNRELHDYVLSWMVRTIQKPDRPIGVALVLRGIEGTGKGAFATFFSKLFGSHYAHLDSDTHITGRFNSILGSKIVVFADEALFAGDKKHERTLKRLITEPTIVIEYKGKEPIIMPNTLNLIMASNSDFVVPAGINARRFCVLDVGSAHRNDKPYFAAIEKELESGGYGRMLYDLLHADAGQLPDPAIPPKTAALTDQKRQRLEGAEAWWDDVMEREFQIEPEDNHTSERWASEVPKRALYEDYLRFENKQRRSYRPMAENAFHRALKPIFEKTGISESRPHNGRGVYTFPAFDVCKKAWEEFLGYAPGSHV